MAKAKEAKSKKKSTKSKTATYHNYIGGEWVKSSSGEWFENLNPADTSDVIGRFPRSNQEDVNAAVEAAKSVATKWRRTPAPKRAEILFKLARILERDKQQFSHEMTREMGKVLKETGGDVQEAIDCTYFTAGEGRRMHGFTTKAEMPNKYAMCERQPVGICGLITPFNFPMAIPSWKLIPALVCGNAVVMKSGEDVPLSTINLVKACEEAGIPKGVVNVVNGFQEPGEALVKHRDVRLISFTGSTDTGRIIAEECARSNKIVSLEMGGKNAIIIMDDADIDNAVEGSLWGAFGTSGQRCTASSRLVVHKKVYKKFTEKLVERVKKLKVGNGLDEKTDVGPVINQAAMDKILSYIEIGKKEDKATLACG
ncbi:MAG: aldehyde dehydrogenase family protein, partial [Acidobacteriota bacterium]|nr:aldehyde dehydrogenase family protein [Acidobacteriota bacterium]